MATFTVNVYRTIFFNALYFFYIVSINDIMYFEFVLVVCKLSTFLQIILLDFMSNYPAIYRHKIVTGLFSIILFYEPNIFRKCEIESALKILAPKY